MLAEQIQKDMVEAMRNKESTRLSTLRLLSSEIKNAEIELRPEVRSLTDEEIIKVISKEAKKRRESIEIYEAQNREDLATQEKAELEVLENYLPTQMNEEEIKKVLQEIVNENPEISFGDLMKEAMPKLKGQADGKLVSQTANKILNSK